MKPKKQQLPKAIYDRDSHGKPVAIIPTATAKQAKAIAAFFNLSEEEQVEKLAMAMFGHKSNGRDFVKWKGWGLADACRDDARAVLRRIKEGHK